MLTIDFVDDSFVLRHEESHRTFTVPANANGINYLRKIIRDSKRGFSSQPKGYCRNFPTQHIIDKWIAADRPAPEPVGINLAGLGITL